MNYVSIRSKAFPGSYIKGDGTGITEPLGGGGGTVTPTKTVNPLSRFLVEKRMNGTVAIRCPAFDDVYLRLDGRFDKPADRGSGVVNLQYTAGPYELFKFAPQGDGSVTIESVEFPGRFLRLGDGVVNAQLGAGPYEMFYVRPA